MRLAEIGRPQKPDQASYGRTRLLRVDERKTVMGKPHTGGKAPKSGIYKPDKGGKQIAVSKGDTLPPAKGKGTDYTLVQPTK